MNSCWEMTMLRLWGCSALLIATLAWGAAPVQAKEYRLEDDQPCSLLTLLACDAGLYNIMKELKKQYPDKVSLSAEEIDKEVQRLQDYVQFARGNLAQRLKPEAVQNCRMDMLHALEAIDRKEGASLEESYNSCQQSAEAIGQKYDGQVNGQVAAVAPVPVASAPAGEVPSVAAARTQAAARPQRAKPTDEQVAAYEKKRMELWSRMKELEREMDNEHQKLLELDNAKAPQDRTKEDWAAMDAQAMKLLDAIGKQTDASREHGKHVFQDFDTKYSRQAIQ